MPRKSAEARATLTAAGAGKLEPSDHLSADEKTCWLRIVDATPAGHLSERDRPLLESYVALAVAQRRFAADLAGEDRAAARDAIKSLGDIARTLASISNRLKIAPLANNPDAHKAGQRNEKTKVHPLLGGRRA